MPETHVDQTHDPARTSWVESARGHADFPLQNLPFGVFRTRDDDEPPRVGVAIGDAILDVTACHDEGRFTGAAEHAAEACAAPTLNSLMAVSSADRSELRRQVSDLLDAESPAWKANRRLGDRLLVAMADAELLLPASIG